MGGFGCRILRTVISEGLIIDRVYEPEGVHYPDVYLPQENPLKEVCLRYGIEYRQTPNINENAQELRNLSPRLIMIGTFNQILKKELLDIPKNGSFNLHLSKLPFYRGRTPTFWAIANAEVETAVTLHLLQHDKIDTGYMYAQEPVMIEKTDTDGRLRDKLSLTAGRLAAAFLKDASNSKPIKYVSDEHPILPYRTIAHTYIQWNKKTDDILNLIRASNPWPLSRTTIVDGGEPKTILISSAECYPYKNKKGKAGIVEHVYRNGDIEVSLKDGSIMICRVAEPLHGIKAGAVLVSPQL
ncbi:methionyl-tRNA formyltransferase [Candidatus Magnetominusculus xianensis]|uniref:Methionyl-tRNA formyltransferase n=1 Tax=Candidatus Magnetominusculus xianensis TaxID=1748249 RepID=A0ABR5SC37_9BACT|nr:formyltransferase family protein [Candidatus Magnetominusculus xianensis]KWT78356.1 methionyl-tRNA formyltransferase [Candidatus Magnetominusculus xianensis]